MRGPAPAGERAELLRRYLQARAGMGEPELLLPGRSRREALRAVRELADALDRGVTLRTDDEDDAPGGPDDASSVPVAAGDVDNDAMAVGPGYRPTPPPAPDDASASPSLPAEELTRLSREAEADELRGLPDLATLRSVANGCLRCPLREGRQHVVFGEGHPRARVVCVGEAPGAVEDRTGRPFVGPAGKLLDRLLLSAGFLREEIFICNVLKCRPPGNRNPRAEEIEQCSPYLHRQIELLDPAVIVAFGTFASRTLLGVRESLGSMRARTHLYRGYPLVVTYHPAALLRNPNWTRPTWEDLQRVRAILEGGSSRRPSDSPRMQQDVFDQVEHDG